MEPASGNLGAGRRLRVTLLRCRGGVAGKSVEIDIDDRSGVVPAIESPWIVVPGESAQAVRAAPLADLRLPDATLALLGQLRIERIGQLVSLPHEGLGVRFGPLVSRRLAQLTGAAVELIRPYRPLPPVRGERCWERLVATARPYRGQGTSRPPLAPRIWRTRPDVFADVWPQVQTRLEADAQLQAVTLFRELMRERPVDQILAFHRRQIRDLQVFLGRRPLARPTAQFVVSQAETGRGEQFLAVAVIREGARLSPQRLDHVLVVDRRLVATAGNLSCRSPGEVIVALQQSCGELRDGL